MKKNDDDDLVKLLKDMKIMLKDQKRKNYCLRYMLECSFGLLVDYYSKSGRELSSKKEIMDAIRRMAVN